MSEPVTHCTRCGAGLAGDPSLVRVESGPLQSAHPELTLCSRCTDSFRRWIARRNRGASANQGGGAPRTKDPSDPRRHPPRGSPAVVGEKEARLRGLIVLSVIFGTGIVVTLVAVALLNARG